MHTRLDNISYRALKLALLLCFLISNNSYSEEGAGAALFGVAAITQAAAGIVAPAVQAAANVAVERTGAAASITNATTVAGVTSYITSVLANVSLFQTFTALDIVRHNNYTSLLKEAAQLSVIKYGRDIEAYFSRDKLHTEYEYKYRLLRQEEAANKANTELGNLALLAARVKNGTSLGFKDVTPAGTFGVGGIARAPSNIAAATNKLVSAIPQQTSFADLKGGLSRPKWLPEAVAAGSSNTRKVTDLGVFKKAVKRVIPEGVSHSKNSVNNISQITHRGASQDAQSSGEDDGSISVKRINR